jgi:hypothetical protein
MNKVKLDHISTFAAWRTPSTTSLETERRWKEREIKILLQGSLRI